MDNPYCDLPINFWLDFEYRYRMSWYWLRVVPQ